MRAAAMSVWVFINLLFFGMCGYLYLIWSQYWMYIEKQRFLNRPTEVKTGGSGLSHVEGYHSERYVQSLRPAANSSAYSAHKHRRSAVRALWSSRQQPPNTSGEQSHPTSNVVVRIHGGPRFPNLHNPVLEFDSEKYQCDDFGTNECATRTEEFKESLLKEFHRVLMGDGNVFKSGLEVQNTYNVQYSGVGREVSGRGVLCALAGVRVRTVRAGDEPFASLGYRIPARALQAHTHYNTCAVVTSAGALLGSRLGEFIDSHDMVLRFNNAPTENYTDDVGSKTTFRILNSQVASKSEYKFLESPMYRNVSILVWDPANYSSTLEEWYQHPDFPLFPVYKKLLDQRKEADVHLLRPEVLWQLWTVLQDSSPYRLRRNPPSSGFIGLWFALHRCARVRVFEYVPSARATRRCHYHAARDDAACTLGAWHPLAQEKALAERMRDNPDVDVFQRGFIDVPGVKNVRCG